MKQFSIFSKYFKGDPWLWITTFMISFIGILAVYSAITPLATQKKVINELFLGKHILMILLGFVMMFFMHRVDYRILGTLSIFAIWLCVPLLIYTLLQGVNIHNASRWLRLPIINLTFQPSDFAKIALIIYVARQLSVKQKNIKDFYATFLPIIFWIAIICGLIAPMNLSTASMLFLVCFILMFIGRISLLHLALIVCISAVGLIGLFKVSPRSETWQKRIESYLYEDSFQSEQAKIAVATSGFLGKGPGKSTQKYLLPQPYNDFIFAIIIEEYGLIGALLVLFLYLFFTYRAILVVNKLRDKIFGTLLVIGLSLNICLQALVNMGVAVNVLPVTGLALPMLSMGGTSILFNAIAIGIIISISREAEENNNTTLSNLRQEKPLEGFKNLPHDFSQGHERRVNKPL
ncbi:MAG: FtsW/RodA/SpoVE family cell cycle protein [Bacteroidia bacterium]|nr:FtsW/RodA/SpoVE family cell cycle protein [Bacteroidia bacterium]MDW8348422.1 FtsW/RodA/SpoVE family cell cycle protein [Bacteroidia bacterium]